MLLGQQTHLGVDDLIILYLEWSHGLGCDLHRAHILLIFLQYFDFLNGQECRPMLSTEGGKDDKLHRNSPEH